MYFLVFKCLLKTVSKTLWFDPYSIVLPRILLQISTKSSYVFGVQKPIQKIVSGTIWFDILSFQGSYVNVHLSYIYFLVLKMSWKILSGTVQFDCYFPFQGFHFVSKVFIKFESRTVWFHPYLPFRKHWSIFIKSTLRSR